MLFSQSVATEIIIPGAVNEWAVLQTIKNDREIVCTVEFGLIENTAMLGDAASPDAVCVVQLDRIKGAEHLQAGELVFCCVEMEAQVSDNTVAPAL